ncbi:MAG TPA: GNAT family N-acetyltransferase [Candidatus Baltobacteraceae bacterium]|nr:GNAT family N-acetyltransferase [Candidatus Baltobacteraceae bacterium]
MNRIAPLAPSIRPGTLAELDAYADFWIAMFEEVGNIAQSDMLPDWRARFGAYLKRRIADNEARFFVAVEDGVTIGTAGALIADGYPYAVHGIKRGYVFGVRVDPECRNRGIATRLTQEAVAYLRDIGCVRIRLHASRFGRPIYERLGFVPTNEMELL